MHPRIKIVSFGSAHNKQVAPTMKLQRRKVLVTKIVVVEAHDTQLCVGIHRYYQSRWDEVELNTAVSNSRFPPAS